MILSGEKQQSLITRNPLGSKDMSIKSNYRPSDLAYYTTWWLSSKSSNSSQMTTISGRNSIKSEDESTIPQEVIIYMII